MNLQNRGGYFNPRSPHGERPAFLLMLHAHITFQSTLPARGATKSHKEYYISPHDFNPRSPHGERPHFSIFGIVSAKFQSTLPARGATLQLLQERAVQGISIHAPRTGSDCSGVRLCYCGTRFQSTLPARGATRLPTCNARCMRFQSTLPARGATRVRDAPTRAVVISIHAPRTGSDDFLPAQLLHRIISIHAPRTGSDSISTVSSNTSTNFNPRSPHGERQVQRTTRD